MIAAADWAQAQAQTQGQVQDEAKPAEKKLTKEAAEYYKKESRLNTLKGRIDDANSRFKELVAAKERTVDAVEKKKIAEQMIDLATSRNKWVKEYNTLRLEVKYRYPGRGDSIERRFVPMQERTADELAEQSDLDKELTVVRRKVERKYKAFNPEVDEQTEIQKAESEKEEKPKLRLVK